MMKKKLRSSKGMTLTELLVALAVVSLISMSLAVGVSSAANVYRESTQLFEAETLCGTILTYLEDEFRFGRNIRTETTGEGAETKTKVIFDSQTFGNDVEVVVQNGKIWIKNSTGSADPGFALLGDKAYTSGLKVLESADKSMISYDESNGKVTIRIAVGPNTDKTYAEHTVTVVPVDD